MTDKRTIMFLSIVCIFTLMLSISSTLVYGADDNGSQNYKLAGTWVMEGLTYGTLMTEVTACTGDASCRSASSSARFIISDYTLGGLYPDATPVQTPFVIEYHRTGRDTYEVSALHYVRNKDGSVAWFWIVKGIGRWLDENTRASSDLLYLYNGSNPNPLGMPPNFGPDAMPLDETDLIFGVPFPDLVIHKRLNTVIPSLDPPADHFTLP